MDKRQMHIYPKLRCGQSFPKKNNPTMHILRVYSKKRFIYGTVDPTKLNKVGYWDGADAYGISFTSKSNLKNHICIAHLGLQRIQKRKYITKEDDMADNQPSLKKAHILSLLCLTGPGYKNKSGCYISCLLPSCSYRFVCVCDSSVHLSHCYGLINVEIQSLLYFWANTDNQSTEMLISSSLDSFSNYVTLVKILLY